MTDVQNLAEKYAPVIYHAAGELNLPANVDWFLARTSLWFYDRACNLKERIAEGPSQNFLVAQTHGPSCGAADTVSSAGTRSREKHRTFFLADVAPEDRRGCPDPQQWTTYYHAYANDRGGTTLQYWRFYAYNTGGHLTLPVVGNIEAGYHGGDWEGVHVVLDDAAQPQLVRLLGHSDINEVPWGVAEKEDTHPIIYAELNGHSSLANGSRSGIRQETWGGAQGAKVIPPGQPASSAGSLVNLGEKTAPADGQLFIRYSGLWGSPSGFLDIPLVPAAINQKIFYSSSGYWGPAYNETAMSNDGFITAWGKGTSDPDMRGGSVPEFFATSISD